MNPLVMALMAAARQRQSQGPLVYESVITPADFHIATKDGEAMFFHDSIDFSTYAGTDAGNTPYKFVLTDGSGNRAEAWGGAVGGGEALGASMATGTLISGRLYKITATEADHFGTGLVIGDYFTSDGTETCDANNTVEPLTDVAATGLHLMSSMDGTTRNMSLVESGFDPNNVTSVKIYRDANYLYDDTVSSLRISAVDGTAFLDNLPAAALGYVNGRNWVTITDSAGKKLEGVLKAKGTGETITALPNDVTGITKADPGVVSSVAHALSVGSLTFFDSLTEMTELNDAYRTVAVVGSVDAFSINDTSGYGAAETTGGACGHVVTTPSTSGCTIVDGELSTTENFASVESGFAFNEASYRVEIARPHYDLVYSGTFPLKISAVDGTAFVDGVDESVYESDFSSDLDGWGIGRDDETSTWAFDTDHGVLAVTSVGTSSVRPFIYKTEVFPGTDVDYYSISLNYTVNSGTCVLQRVLAAGVSNSSLDETLTGSGTYTITVKKNPTGSNPDRCYFYFDGRNTFNLSIHSITVTKHPFMPIPVTYADGRHLLEIEDASGNVLKGVLSEQGSGEVLGSELVTNGDFSTGDLTGWVDVNSHWSVVAGKAYHSSSSVFNMLLTDAINNLDGLIFVSLDATINSGVLRVQERNAAQSPLLNGRGVLWSENYSAVNTGISSSDTYQTYYVLEGLGKYIAFARDTGTAEFSIDNVSIKQVTAPSTSGAVIVSERSGSTQNFSTVPAGFVWNASSYTVRVKKILL